MTIRLSKSKLIAFRQCPKRLWLEIHRPDLRSDDSGAQRRFEIGHRLGKLAQTQYADGVLIAPDNHLGRALRETKDHLKRTPRKTLFEATFQAEGILVRADLLIPVKTGWHMVEVKSAGQVKDNHLEDAAIQSWVAKKSGLRLAYTSLEVVDSKWTYRGGNHYSGLLKLEPIDALIAPLLPEVPKWLSAAQKTAAKSEPRVKMGKQCGTPFACGFQAYCESLTTPAQFPIAWLPRLHSSKQIKFEAAGFDDMRQLPAEALTANQRKVLDATISNTVFFEPLTPAKKKSLKGTRYYLDFETITFTVPLWANTKPYQQIPFQWSCHIEQPTGALSDQMFLDLSGNDPSRAFAESLVRTLGKKGPILVYSQAFEKQRIEELADRFSDLAPALNKLLDRVIDLKPLVTEHYYHPDMQGSWSVKSVLPTIAPELDYANLEEVADGAGAQQAYLEAIHVDTSAERKAALRAALRTYCHRDTKAMVVMLHFLADEIMVCLR